MNHLSVDERFSMRTPKVTKKFRFLYNKGVVHDDAQSRVFIINLRFPPAPYSTLLRPAVLCLNFVPRKVCFWVFAFLRELKGNCVSFCAWWVSAENSFHGKITGGQSALLGGRACPEVAILRELKGNCVSFW